MFNTNPTRKIYCSQLRLRNSLKSFKLYTNLAKQRLCTSRVAHWREGTAPNIPLPLLTAHLRGALQFVSLHATVHRYKAYPRALIVVSNGLPRLPRKNNIVVRGLKGAPNLTAALTLFSHSISYNIVLILSSGYIFHGKGFEQLAKFFKYI